MQCLNCGTVNAEGAKFCRGCGHALTAPAAPPAPAVPAPTPAVAPPPPAARPAWLGQPPNMADLLLALMGTGLGALAGILSTMYLPRIVLRYHLLPILQTAAITAAAALASALVLVLTAYWAADSRATRESLRLKKLIQKDRAVFMSIDADVTLLVGQES